MTKSPKFSVILPTFNREKFIVKTVESILKQSFKDYEILLVDDGSTDNTKQVINDAFETHHKLRYFYGDNGERGAARNFGMANARAEYLVFLDSDDVMDHQYLENLNRYIKKYPDCNFFGCKYDIVDTFGENSSPIGDLKPGFYDYKLLLKGNVFACNICCKKN